MSIVVTISTLLFLFLVLMEISLLNMSLIEILGIPDTSKTPTIKVSILNIIFSFAVGIALLLFVSLVALVELLTKTRHIFRITSENVVISFMRNELTVKLPKTFFF